MFTFLSKLLKLPKKKTVTLESTSATEGNLKNDQQTSKTTLSELPLELLDALLANSFLHWILNSSLDQRNEDVIRALASVDFCWFQRITRRRFKIRIWHRLKDFYGKTKKRSSLIRNNRNYFLENIRPNDELFESLLSFNCITQEQSHFIQQQRSEQDKNAELLYVMESIGDTKFSNFVNCFRQNNQKTVARIIENGGVVIKVEMQIRGETSMETQLLHQKFKDLQNRTKPKSYQSDKIISQLKEEGIDILNSGLDRQTVVIWIWCHSQAALEHIQWLYDSSLLIDILFDIASFRPSTSEIIQSKSIYINSNEFKKTVVPCPTSTNFTEKIDVGEYEKVSGVTKLRNEIYVLCHSTSAAHVIRVFEDENPFHLLKKIEIKGSTLKENGCYGSGDIVSSDIQNCLYICGEKHKLYFPDCVSYSVEMTFYDSVWNYVWKLTKTTDDQHKAIKWLTIDYEPFTLSVCSDGQLLVISKSSTILMIYGSDAELIRSIQLPRGMTYPLHAVETSIGNFIITHKLREEEEKVESGSIWKERETKWVVSELTRDGQMVIRRFIPSNETQKLDYPLYLSLDSDDRVFVLDAFNNRVIILDPDLKWNRILLSPKEEGNGPRWTMGMFNDEEKKQLFVFGSSYRGVNVYSISGT